MVIIRSKTISGLQLLIPFIPSLTMLSSKQVKLNFIIKSAGQIMKHRLAKNKAYFQRKTIRLFKRAG